MIEEEGSLYFEEEDQCMDCKHSRSGTICPLLEAIYAGVVYLREEGFAVKNCDFFQKFENPLKLVKKDKK
jgi:hypothetical protein